MGIIKKLTSWLGIKKDEAPQEVRNMWDKRRGNLSVKRINCPSCGHHKTFMKRGKLKCTRCKKIVE